MRDIDRNVWNDLTLARGIALDLAEDAPDERSFRIAQKAWEALSNLTELIRHDRPFDPADRSWTWKED